MKKIVSIVISITILMLIAISPVSANNYYEDNGDFRYIYQLDGSILNALYKKASSKQEIMRIEFPVEYKGKKIDYIGFIGLNDAPKVENLKVNTIFIPKTIDRLPIHCVDNPDFDELLRIISLRNIEVDKDNPYLCSKDGVLYSKDMKEMKLYPDRNNMTEYKMPSCVEEAYDLKKRNNIRKLYLSDNLKIVWYNLARNCKKLEYVRIGENTTDIWEKAFYANKKLRNVEIESKRLKKIGMMSFSKCSRLNKINIPPTVKIIGKGAFWQCKSLKKITLPKNLKSIGFSAFADCKKLSKVIINNKKKAPKILKDSYNSETGVYKDAFKNTKKGIKFYVKNKKVAKSLKKQLKDSGVRNAKILIGKKVVYKNVK